VPLDYVVGAHVFLRDWRQFYALEELWVMPLSPTWKKRNSAAVTYAVAASSPELAYSANKASAGGFVPVLLAIHLCLIRRP
jgi:hypothetical protein